MLAGASVVTTATLDAGYTIDACMVGGLTQNSVVDSHGIIANILLRDGIESSNTFSALLVADSELDDGIAQTLTVLRADLRADAVISGGAAANSSIDAALRCSITLSGGVSTYSLIDSHLVCSIKLFNAEFYTNAVVDAVLIPNVHLNYGVAAQNETGGTLRIVPPIIVTGGVYSDYQLSDADISSYYGDMLHNTWQLEITSATELLEISSPIGDS